MDRHAYLSTRHFLLATSLAALATVTLGCGSQVAESEAAAQPGVGRGPAVAPATAQDTASPTDVVSRFLDEFRRGGSDSTAEQLLTTKARQELARIGLSVQPIGTPDANFVVTRAAPAPGEPQSRLVESVLSEPNPDGTVTESEVVWAVERESAGWRISGFAMQVDPEAEPIIVDFENGDLMAKLMGNPQAAPNAAAASQPVAEPANLTR